MSRTTGIALIIWNAVLTVLLGWALLRQPSPTAQEEPAASDTTAIAFHERDTTALRDARVAYFFMDTLRSNLELLKDRSAHYEQEGRRLQGNWQREMAKAEARFQELMTKDQTYSTQAEQKADEEELGKLRERIGMLKEDSEEQLARLEHNILKEVSSEVEEFLKAYNEKAHFDYIISVEPGGQIWVGNPELDITADVRDGLNAQYRAKKAAGK